MKGVRGKSAALRISYDKHKLVDGGASLYFEPRDVVCVVWTLEVACGRADLGGDSCFVGDCID